jgi:hypothetical protein
VLEDALRCVTEREAFGRKIGEFQALQHYIANVAMWREQADLIVTKAAWLQARGLPCQREATMAKVIASELANQAAITSLRPARSTASTSPAGQSEKYSRSPCHRGDSSSPRPVSSVRGPFGSISSFPLVVMDRQGWPAGGSMSS